MEYAATLLLQQASILMVHTFLVDAIIETSGKR